MSITGFCIIPNNVKNVKIIMVRMIQSIFIKDLLALHMQYSIIKFFKCIFLKSLCVQVKFIPSKILLDPLLSKNGQKF